MPFLTITLVFYILKKILLDALAFKLSVLSALLYFVPQESHWAVLDSKYSTKVKIKYTWTKYQQKYQIHLDQIHLDKVPTNTPNTLGQSTKYTKYTWTKYQIHQIHLEKVPNTPGHLGASARAIRERSILNTTWWPKPPYLMLRVRALVIRDRSIPGQVPQPGVKSVGESD